MKNFIFEVLVGGPAVVCKPLLARANTEAEAQKMANLAAVGWWGNLTGFDPEHNIWGAEDEWDVFARPICKGEFTESELQTLRRAVSKLVEATKTEADVIDTLNDGMENGMSEPPTEMLVALFGEAFAARFQIEKRV